MKGYDFALAWNSGKKEQFIVWIKRECGFRNLKALLINNDNVLNVIEALEKGSMKIKFLLDNEANYNDLNDLYARLCYAVKDANGYVICDPDDARAASNKSVAHYDLTKAKIPVPYTVVVRNWEPDDFILSKPEIKKLGVPFVIKPASGFGQKGVIKNANGSIVEIAEARHFNRGDNFLLQEKIVPILLDSKPAWFRVYFLLGEIIPCWWNPETGWYKHVTLREMYKYKLLPLARIVSDIARVTDMEFFTSEISVTGEGKDRRFVAIDYVNDQPELCVRSEKSDGAPVGGPVPEVVEHIAERIVDIAWRMLNNVPIGIYRSIWLAKAKTTDEDL